MNVKKQKKTNEQWVGQLHKAAKDGDVQHLRECISKWGIKALLQADQTGSMAVHYSAWYGQVQCLEEILTHGGGQEKNKWGQTALHLSAKAGHEQCVKLLLEYGCEAKKDQIGSTPLMYAAQEGHVQCVKALIGHSDVNAKESASKATALHLAALGGHVECVKALITHSNVEAKVSPQGLTALGCAITAGSYGCAQALISEGADVSVVDNMGRNIVHMASENGSGLVMALVLPLASASAKDKAGVTPLHLASDRGSVRALEQLIGCKDVNVNAKTNEGYTPLMHALHRMRMAAVKMLLPLSDVGVCDKKGNSVLHYAAHHGKKECIELLLKDGRVDVQWENKNGQKAWQVCPDNEVSAWLQQWTLSDAQKRLLEQQMPSTGGTGTLEGAKSNKVRL